MAETINAVTPFTVTRFRCPTCRKTGSSRTSMQAHADTCIHNPASKGCATCAADEEVRIPTDRGHRVEYRCAKGWRGSNKRAITGCPLWVGKAEG